MCYYHNNDQKMCSTCTSLPIPTVYPGYTVKFPCKNCRDLFDNSICKLCDNKCYYKHILYDNVIIRGNYLHTCDKCGHMAHWLCSQKNNHPINPIEQMKNIQVTCTSCQSPLKVKSNQIRPPIKQKNSKTTFRLDIKQLFSNINITRYGTFKRIRNLERLYNHLVSHKDEFLSQFTDLEKNATRDCLLRIAPDWDVCNTPYYLDALNLTNP